MCVPFVLLSKVRKFVQDKHSSTYSMDCDFIERLHRINLFKEEGEVCQVRATRRKEILEECLLSLLGRFLTTQPYNQMAAKSLLKMVWKLGSDLRIIDVREGLFQFKFTLESQLK